MKKNILRADYCAANGVSTIVKSNRWGTFTATVKVHEEDEDIANLWDGLAFAEYKADTMAMKEKTRAMRERFEGLRTAINAIEPPGDDEYDYTWDKLMIQYEIAWREYQDAKHIYEKMKSSYRDFVEDTLTRRRSIRSYIAERNETLGK